MCSPERGEGVSCDQVLQSPWARIRFPIVAAASQPAGGAAATNAAPAPQTLEIPVAWIGMAYFSSLGIWLLFVGQPSYSRRLFHLVPLLIVVPGAAGSVYFMYLLVYKLPAVCPLCIATHALNGLILLGTLLLWPRRPSVGTDRAVNPSFRQAATTFVLMLVSSWTVLMAQFLIDRAAQADGAAMEARRRLQDFESNPEAMRAIVRDGLAREGKQEIPIDEDDPILGAPDARRTLVIFSDFQCPQCRRFHDHLKQLLPAIQRTAAPQGGLRFVFKHYPMHTRCNSAPKMTNLHAYACDAALAVEAARIVGGAEAFWQMADLAFARQDQLYQAPYAAWAKELGLDVSAFETARRSPEAAERIRRHVQQALSVRVRGTPSPYLDGVNVKRLMGSSEKVWNWALSSPVWPPTRESLR
jgi:protein-disulfide isomerase